MSVSEFNTAKEKQDKVMLMLTALWALAIAIGFFSMVDYQNSAAVVYQNPSEISERFNGADNCNVLIMALHPHCSCSRASLSELHKLQSNVGDAVRVYVLVYVPDGQDKGWAEGISLAQLSRMNTEVIYDPGGKICLETGLNTSGETLLYNAQGSLLFSGGVTASRGHAGSNYGIEFLHDAISRKQVERTETPVFGCAIRSIDIEKEYAVERGGCCNVE